MAVVAAAVGKVITRGIATVEIFVPPKSSTATDLLDLLLLYIKAPEIEVLTSPVKVAVLNDKKAVVPVEVGVTAVSTIPPAVYPVPVISPVAVYMVVFSPSEAVGIYKAILNTSPVEVVKLCVAVRIWTLNEVVSVCAIIVLAP
jgi:hypothetical protein